ncbi:hypothetical protein ACI8AF_13370 [Blastococcus sp. SYSU D00669]
MLVAVLILVSLTVVGGLALTLLGERVRPAWTATVPVASLGVAAVLAWVADPASGGVVQATVLLAFAAAVVGGGPVATAVLRSADPTDAVAAGGPGDPDVLRGGAWIGVLERAAVAGTLLVGWPEGLAVVLAVKGLGRFAELKVSAAAERFILGTLASALWAVACVGVVELLRR